MIKLLYQPTTVRIAPNAVKKAFAMYGEDVAPLMLASLKNMETKSTKPASFIDKIIHKLATKSKLTLDVDVNPNSQFTISATRDIGIYTFNGKPKTFELGSTLNTLKELNKAVLAAKEPVLEEVGQFNKFKKIVRIKPLDMFC